LAGPVAYLDSSAFVKRIVAEPESLALRRAIARWPQRASSTLLRAETIRPLRRSGNTAQGLVARRLLRAVGMLRIDEPLSTGPSTWSPANCARWTPSTWHLLCRSARTSAS